MFRRKLFSKEVLEELREVRTLKMQQVEVNKEDRAGKIQEYAGPELPPHLLSKSSVNTDPDDSDLIGPQLPLPNTTNSSTAHEFEMRSLKMKQKLTQKVPERAVRESWMTEIPERLGSDLGVPVAKTKFGDGKKKIDSSGWAANPQDKQTIQTSEDSDLSKNFCEERDRATASVVETYSKKARPNSLLEMHQKKLKKEMKKKKKKEKKDKLKKKHKKDKKDKTSERLPFDRDRDLQVNVFDDAKKRALIKHSQQLTSRFSNSTVQGQFL